MYRREFLSRTVGAAVYGLVSPAVTHQANAQPASLQNLTIVKRTIEVNGKAGNALGVVRPDGSSGLVLDAGMPFNVEVTNKINAPTLIHWHGLTPPWDQDGVPENPKAPIKPIERRHYSFRLSQSGTHWMHAHTLQEQSLLAAPLIIHTAADRRKDEQEVVVLLHDFSFRPPEELLADLKHKGGRGMGTSNQDVRIMTAASGGSMSMDMGQAISGPDANDIEYDAYLSNDRTLDDPEVFRVEKGGRVRIRLINGAASTGFTVDTGELQGTLTAVDGNNVSPVRGRKFPAAMAQRLDIVVEIPKAGGSFPILLLREGAPQQTGFFLATPGANIARVATSGDAKGPPLGLDLELRLQPLNPLPHRRVDRSYQVNLVGRMAPYSWSIDGPALDVRAGERVEIEIRNMSMMSHPIHLHGHTFQVVGINGRRMNGAIRDTVLLPTASTVTIAFDANNPGHWPFHCHNLYHMESGMMTYIRYEA